MTDKILNFPSMDEPDDDDYGSDSHSDSDSLLNELFRKNERGEYEPFRQNYFDDDDRKGGHDSDADYGKKDDGIRAGELEAYNRAKEIIGSEGFQYFPDEASEENNQRFSMAHLQKDWGRETQKNIGFANFFYRNFLHKGSQKEAEQTGIASHYLMVKAFYEAARHAENFATKMMRGESETGIKTLKFKRMSEGSKRQLEERCRDLASRVYNDAKNKIIKIHGGISWGG